MTVGNFNTSGLLPNLSIIMNTDLTNIPADFTQVATLDGKYLKGIPTAVTDPDSDIGNATHTHTSDGDHVHAGTVSSHSHSGVSNISNSSKTAIFGGISVSNTHTHDINSDSKSLAEALSDGSHTHNAFTNDLEHRTISFYKKDDTITNMSTKALPSNVTLFYSKTGTFPDGFLENLNYVDKHIKGDVTPNTNAGSNLHQHDNQSHNHPTDISDHEHVLSFSGVNGDPFGSGTGTGIATISHTHGSGTASTINKSSTPVTSGNSAGHQHDDISHEPAFKTLRLLTTGSVSMSKAGVPRNCLLLWLDLINQIPIGWQVSDGTNNTIDMLDRYPKGSATPNSTGGGSHTHSEDNVSHSHSGADVGHSHNTTGISGTDSGDVQSGVSSGLAAVSGHTHNSGTVDAQVAQTVTITNGASNHDHGAQNSDPESKTVAFIQRINS